MGPAPGRRPIRARSEGVLYPRFTTYDHKAMGVHVLPTTQFKTNALILNIQAPLSEAKVTKTALLPHLMVRGTDRTPTQAALMARLEELYGAYLFADTFKLGERHILQLRLDVANGNYLPGQSEEFLGSLSGRLGRFTRVAGLPGVPGENHRLREDRGTEGAGLTEEADPSSLWHLRD